MSVFARSATPIPVSIGRLFTLPVTYTDPASGAPIPTTGMDIEAAIKWTGQASPLSVAVTQRDDTDASAVLELDPVVTASLPPDRVMTLLVSYTDSVGSTDDVQYTLWGVVP